MTRSKPKLLIYCQHVLGIGHFMRSFNLAKSLDQFQVLFVEGGKPVEDVIVPSFITRVFIPPLSMDQNFNSFTVSNNDIERLKNERRDKLLQYYNHFRPDIIVTELFPFGRMQFEYELLPLLQHAKEQKTYILSSIRDILVTCKGERTIDLLQNFFHGVLVHSDHKFISLEESFPMANLIPCPVFYTGHIASEYQNTAKKTIDTRIRIALSSGGGRVGHELILSVIEAIKTLDKRIELHIFIGALMEEHEKAEIISQTANDKRFIIRSFTLGFSEELQHFDLSISMCGYNTSCDIIKSEIPALVYPFEQNSEQSIRAKKLELLNYVTIIKSLDINDLASLIEKKLFAGRTPKLRKIDINGAQQSATIINREYRKHASKRRTTIPKFFSKIFGF